MRHASPPLAARLAGVLGTLAPAGRIGVAVSGGPDSLALLLLLAKLRVGSIEAATVDHGLREGSGAEARLVARYCALLDVPHSTLEVEVQGGASLQAQARRARYAALANWAQERGLAAVATAHHADDQAETLLMRLARGSGVGGLAGIRTTRPLTEGVQLIRPLLGARKSELEEVLAAAGWEAVDDPANSDPKHDRTQARALLRSTDWIAPSRLGRTAVALAEAEEALAFAADRLAAEQLRVKEYGLSLDVAGLPAELQRRLLLKGLAQLGAATPRGGDVDRALACLASGGCCTLGSVKLSGGAARWTLVPAPPRRDRRV